MKGLEGNPNKLMKIIDFQPQFTKIMKSYAEINEKIKNGTAVVLTAEEVSELSKT